MKKAFGYVLVFGIPSIAIAFILYFAVTDPSAAYVFTTILKAFGITCAIFAMVFGFQQGLDLIRKTK